MKRLLPWLVLWFPLAAWAQATDAHIEIRCQTKQACSAEPEYLVVGDQKSISVTSSEKWDCFTYDPVGNATSPGCLAWQGKAPGTAGHPALIFCRTDRDPADHDAGVVVPLLIEQPASPNLGILPWSAALLAAVSALLSLFLWAGASAPAKTLSDARERLLGDLQPLQAKIDSVTANLRFREIPPQREPERVRERDRDRSPSSEDTRRTVSPASEPQAIAPDRVRFRDCIDAWKNLAPTVPPEIGTQETRLLSAGPNISAAELKSIAETVAKVAVRSTGEMAAATREWAKFEEAMRNLVRSAGLTLIEPRLQDPFDDDRHMTLGSTAEAPSPQLHGRIAKVKHPGLERSGTVIAKAEVILYD